MIDRQGHRHDGRHADRAILLDHRLLQASANRKEKIAEYKQNFANPYKAAIRGYVDDVIDPADTRTRLVGALAMLLGKRVTGPTRKHGNFPV